MSIYLKTTMISFLARISSRLGSSIAKKVSSKLFALIRKQCLIVPAAQDSRCRTTGASSESRLKPRLKQSKVAGHGQQMAACVQIKFLHN